MNGRSITIGLLAVLILETAAFGYYYWQTSGTLGKYQAKYETLVEAGSTTVLPIATECARLFMVQYPEVRVTTSGGGSGSGISSVGAGSIDIGASSRDIKSSELASYPNLKPVKIAKDSVAVVVHPSNSVIDLTATQIQSIFAGNITNWKDIGGADAVIHVYTRESGSGTLDCFTTFFMDKGGGLVSETKSITGAATVKDSNGAMRTSVAGDAIGIGFISLGYLDATVKALKVNGVEATIANVLSKDYKPVRNLYLITNGEPNVIERAFIQFVLSTVGQKVVQDLGYFPLSWWTSEWPTPDAPHL